MKKIISIFISMLTLTCFFGQDITLPEPKSKSGVDLFDAVKARTTSKNFTKKDVPLEDLSSILWAGNGLKKVDAVSSASKAGRTIPYSGDNAYINIYVLTDKGAYLYVPEKNLLKQVAGKEVRDMVTPEFLKNSSFMIIFTYDLTKVPSFLKGNANAMEAMMSANSGYAAENIILASSSFKLNSIIMYNMKTADIPGILKLSKDEKPISFIQLGY
jgi:nitroreductase